MIFYKEYIVKKNDNLQDLSIYFYATAGEYPKILVANPSISLDVPLQEGKILLIPLEVN